MQRMHILLAISLTGYLEGAAKIVPQHQEESKSEMREPRLSSGTAVAKISHNKKATRELWQAVTSYPIYESDLSRVKLRMKKAIRDGADPNSTKIDSKGYVYTMLFKAKHVDIMEELLDAGTNPTFNSYREMGSLRRPFLGMIAFSGDKRSNMLESMALCQHYCPTIIAPDAGDVLGELDEELARLSTTTVVDPTTVQRARSVQSYNKDATVELKNLLKYGIYKFSEEDLTGKVKKALDEGADPNIFMSEEECHVPLFFRALRYPKLIQLLIDSGANPGTKAVCFRGTVLDQLIMNMNPSKPCSVSPYSVSCIHLLLDRCPSLTAVTKSHNNDVMDFLDRCPYAVQRMLKKALDDHNIRVAQDVSERGCDEVFMQTIQNAGFPTLDNKVTIPALHILLKRFPHLANKLAQGPTLWYAATGHSRICLQVVDCLLKNGADGTVLNADGTDLFQWGIEYARKNTTWSGVYWPQIVEIYQQHIQRYRETVKESAILLPDLLDIVCSYAIHECPKKDEEKPSV